LLFTVFTPTYNRKHLIHRVWDSLRAQTIRDFEWVIIDDGSTDGTTELLEQYAREADFPVRFERQDNGGKHIAWNRGVRMARGELFVSADSDDAFVPEALERFRHWWLSIEPSERPAYSGINVLCKDPETGKVVGDPYPRSPMVTQNLELDYIYRLSGEKWGVIRTDVLREFPFPEDPALRRQYLSENYVWFRIARRYKLLCVNEPLRLYFRDDQGSLINARSGLIPGGLSRHVNTRYFFKNWHVNNNLDYLAKNKKALLKTLVDIWVTGLGSKKSALQVLRDSERGRPLLWRLFALPPGLAAFLYCRFTGANRPGGASPQ
jgi:glycosyltransferase involved in cell wall biosynthesis